MRAAWFSTANHANKHANKFTAVAPVFVMAKATGFAQPCTMKITEAVRKYAPEQGIAEEEALKKGMEEKSREFTENGSELYAKA